MSSMAGESSTTTDLNRVTSSQQIAELDAIQMRASESSDVVQVYVLYDIPHGIGFKLVSQIKLAQIAGLSPAAAQLLSEGNPEQLFIDVPSQNGARRLLSWAKHAWDPISRDQRIPGFYAYDWTMKDWIEIWHVAHFLDIQIATSKLSKQFHQYLRTLSFEDLVEGYGIAARTPLTLPIQQIHRKLHGIIRENGTLSLDRLLQLWLVMPNSHVTKAAIANIASAFANVVSPNDQLQLDGNEELQELGHQHPLLFEKLQEKIHSFNRSKSKQKSNRADDWE